MDNLNASKDAALQRHPSAYLRLGEFTGFSLVLSIRVVRAGQSIPQLRAKSAVVQSNKKGGKLSEQERDKGIVGGGGALMERGR
jgi:hypothetical protein